MSDGSKCSCDGRSLPVVEFDEEAARGLSASEVRKRWPRFQGHCLCGVSHICYASWMHYVMGDW